MTANGGSHVALLFPFPAFGGAEDYAALLAAGLLGRDWRLTAVVPDAVELPANVEELAEGGATLLRAPLDVLNSPVRLSSLLRRLSPLDVVHVNNPFIPGMAAAVAVRPGAVVVTNHTAALEIELSSQGRLLRRLTAPRVDWIVLSQRNAAIQAERIPSSSKRIHVIPQGLPRERFPHVDPAEARAALGLPADVFVVGCVGRIAAQKRYDVMIRAAALVRKRMPSLRLVVVGDGELRREIEALAATELGDALFLGHRGDVPRLLPAFDVYCLTSDFEGLPSSVLEAMAMERPIVATDVHGTGEAVHNGVHGLLVPPGDPGAVARAIQRLAADPELAFSLARRGRERFLADFTVELMVERTDALYRDLLAGRPASGTTGP